MKAVITVTGYDATGIIGKVATLCGEMNINIEDVTQTVLQNWFAMIMIIDISKCNVSHEEMRAKFAALGEEMKMRINITRQEVFDAMHKI